MRERRYTLTHPELEGTGTCLESALPVWLDLGYTVVDVSDLPKPTVTAPAEPLWVVVNDELVPANDAARAQLAAEAEWTAPGPSEETADAADADEES